MSLSRLTRALSRLPYPQNQRERTLLALGWVLGATVLLVLMLLTLAG